MKYEYKYLVPKNRLDELRSMIMPFIELDSFADVQNRGEYTVKSIYFDNASFDYYYEKVDGFKIRKKIRIRGYNDASDSNTVFLEIKRKYYEPISKTRAPLTFAKIKSLFEGSDASALEDLTDGNREVINGAGSFFYHVYSNNLKPVILVIYDREPYHDKFGKGIRITFDKNLRSVAYPGINDLYDENKAMPSIPEYFILEIKFYDEFPFWLRSTIGHLGVIRQSVSKYEICIKDQKLVDSNYKSNLFPNARWHN